MLNLVMVLKRTGHFNLRLNWKISLFSLSLRDDCYYQEYEQRVFLNYSVYLLVNCAFTNIITLSFTAILHIKSSFKAASLRDY